MKKLIGSFSFILIFVLADVVQGAVNQETAKSWQKQANDTRAAVMNVYGELEKMDVSHKPDAKGLIDDAVAQLKEGDKYLKQGDEAMAKKEWEKANFGYNMAWQYYVKAATAGLNAKSILSGQ
ncbi:MAG: hypothetical protein ACHQ6U_06075 [Thermodesulfobacteriota bacterium]